MSLRKQNHYYQVSPKDGAKVMMNCTSLIIINCPLTFDKMTESGETFCQINYIKTDVPSKNLIR